ncbi:orc1/cdc6 family replication initiation protein (plasmid) [Halorussus limi]|uniref:ORC1-type DNA replication protein n=1 Tax=Halorussus limi TaxID=2938695 RepID=A0A8U0I2M4_9EURY|nr:orc1/cdc6 family replication initiation protein [Halorussus limi]UPV77166.1 orc1/cdc6 family replication initiation protein [Halorussus limi]
MTAYEFSPQAFPYENREALLDDYTPDTLVGRDSELEEYHAALLPAINGEQPDNIFLYGKAGVGKTASTKFLLDRLTSDADRHDVSIHTEFLNCDGLNTSYRVGVELVNNYRSADEQISESGYPRSQVYDMLWEELDKRGGLHIIVLDEVDHLNDDSILYQLSRARENDNIETARIAVIGISNDLTFRDSLSPKVRSSLCERQISFSTYDANELQDVLNQRHEVAFQDGALSDDVIPLCAAYGAQESGDARKALDLLLKAGDKAREEREQGSNNDHPDTVTEKHVKEGRKMLEREEVHRGIMDLSENEQIALYALATLHAEGETPIRSRKHYERYKLLSERAKDDSFTSRWMRDQMDDLAMLGLVSVEKKNEGLDGGQYREHDLAQDLSVVVDALSDVIDLVGVHDSIREHVDRTE